MNCWTNTSVTLNDSWGLGAADILQTPLGQPAEFSLRPRYLRGSAGGLQLAHFTIEFSSGYMSDGWQGSMFTPKGTQPVTGLHGLPPWDPSQSAVYRKAIQAATSLSDSRTQRLEGTIPYVGAGGAVGYDTVRLFYAFNAVQGSPIPDLVVIKTTTMIGVPGTVQARQDGDGHGPPN